MLVFFYSHDAPGRRINRKAVVVQLARQSMYYQWPAPQYTFDLWCNAQTRSRREIGKKRRGRLTNTVVGHGAKYLSLGFEFRERSRP
jgi:hypothetical protein